MFDCPRAPHAGLKSSRVASCELARLRTRSRSDRRPRPRAAWFRTGDEGQNPEASEREVTVESWTKLRRLPQLTNRNTPTTVSRRAFVTGSFGHEDGLLTNQNLFLRKYLIVYSPEGMGLLPTQKVLVHTYKYLCPTPPVSEWYTPQASLLPANQRTSQFAWPITGESSVERLLKLKSNSS